MYRLRNPLKTLFPLAFFVDAAGVPILPRASRMQFCLSLRACTCFWQGSMPCIGRIALIVQSLLEICPQISQWRDFADEDVWHVFFPSDGPFFSQILAWRSVDWVNRTRRIDPKTICLGFPRFFTLFGSSDGSERARHNQIEVQFSQQLQHPCHRFFRFESSFPTFYLVVIQLCTGCCGGFDIFLIPIWAFFGLMW